MSARTKTREFDRKLLQELTQNMEHGFADLLSDAFSDVSLPSYQEGDLDFESLNLHERDENGNSNGEFEKPPALTEVDEDDDPEEEEEERCVSVCKSEEELHGSRSGFPQYENWGDTVDLEGQEVGDGQEITAEDEGLMDDKDAGVLSSLSDWSQTISLERGCWKEDQTESGGISGIRTHTQDLGKEQEFSTLQEHAQGSDSGSEGEEEGQRGQKDGQNLPELLSFIKEERGKESLNHSETDSDAEIDIDIDVDAEVDRNLDISTGLDIVTEIVKGVDLVSDDVTDSDADIDVDIITDTVTDIVIAVDPVAGDVTESDEDILTDMVTDVVGAVTPVADDVTDSDTDIIIDTVTDTVTGVAPLADDVIESGEDSVTDFVTDVIIAMAPAANDVTDSDRVVTDIATDIVVTDSDTDIVTDTVTDTVIAVAPVARNVEDSDPDVVADTVTDIVVAVVPVMGDHKSSDIEATLAANKEADAGAWISGFAEERRYSPTRESLDDLLQALPTDPLREELKEFSEADCGVIGEGYAEYPSEEEEESPEGRRLGRLLEDCSPQTGKHSEWELMEGEGCVEQKVGENKGVSLKREREQDGTKWDHEESGLKVDLDVEEEIEGSDSSSLLSEGEGSKAQSTGAHGKLVLDWTEDQGTDEGDNFGERQKDDDGCGEVMHELKWTGEEWAHAREDEFKIDAGQEQCQAGRIAPEVSSASNERFLPSVTRDQSREDEGNVPCVIGREQASADEEDATHVEYGDGRVDRGSGVGSGGRPGDTFVGWTPGPAPSSVPTSDCSSRLSDSESSSSESDTWTYRAVTPATLRGLSTGHHHLQPGLGSQAEGATELSGTCAQRISGAKEEEFTMKYGEEEEEEEEEGAERNWDQERERIQAFYRYYDDEEEDYSVRREGQGSSRKQMVRFCLDPAPLQRDSDSTDPDVVSSSSEGAEDSDTGVPAGSLAGAGRGAAANTVSNEATGAASWMSARAEDSDGESRKEKLSLLLQQSLITQAELKKIGDELKVQHRTSTVPGVLRAAVKLSLVSLLGILMFWWATDQLEWIGQDCNT